MYVCLLTFYVIKTLKILKAHYSITVALGHLLSKLGLLFPGVGSKPVPHGKVLLVSFWALSLTRCLNLVWLILVTYYLEVLGSRGAACELCFQRA